MSLAHVPAEVGARLQLVDFLPGVLADVVYEEPGADRVDLLACTTGVDEARGPASRRAGSVFARVGAKACGQERPATTFTARHAWKGLGRGWGEGDWPGALRYALKRSPEPGDGQLRAWWGAATSNEHHFFVLSSVDQVSRVASGRRNLTTHLDISTDNP
jgi:hypothetical protein